MAAAIQVWNEHYQDFTTLFLRPYESGFPIARIEYVPDGCGITGEDCTGEIWTGAYSTDAVFTQEQIELGIAWEESRDDFMEDREYGLVVNEDRLKAFLASEFDTTPEHISSQFLASTVIPDEIELPEEVKRWGIISAQDRDEAAAATCSQDLQCWGDEHILAATFACRPQIEAMANYDYEWTDGFLGSKLEQFMWKDRGAGIIAYTGNNVRFLDSFGAWVPITYWCDYDPDTKIGTARIP